MEDTAPHRAEYLHRLLTPREGEMAGKWERSDKISAAAMVIALCAALAPLLSHVYSTWHEPRASIDDMTETYNNQICAYEFHTKGTASHIPVDDDLWLVMRSYEGLWYLLGRIQTSSELWVELGVLKDTGGVSPSDIEVVMLTAAQDGQFIRDTKQLGFSSLPPGYRTMAVHTASPIFLPNGSKCSQ